MYCLFRLVGLDFGLNLTIKTIQLSTTYFEPRSTAGDYMLGGGRRYIHFIYFPGLGHQSERQVEACSFNGDIRCPQTGNILSCDHGLYVFL